MTSSINHDYESLLSAAQKVYNHHDEMISFAPFPEDVAQQTITPALTAASHLFTSETHLASKLYQPLMSAILATGDKMCWREVYEAPANSLHPEKYEFKNRFGCYSLVGHDAPFSSQSLSLFIVYMPAHLIYPWHDHPAEEIYLVLSGDAIFKRKGYQDEIIGEGQTMFHESQLAHEIETTDKPMISLVAWRNHLDTPPRLLEDM